MQSRARACWKAGQPELADSEEPLGEMLEGGQQDRLQAEQCATACIAAVDNGRGLVHGIALEHVKSYMEGL